MQSGKKCYFLISQKNNKLPHPTDSKFLRSLELMTVLDSGDRR